MSSRNLVLKHQIHYRREASGFALVSIMVLGFFAVGMMMALFPLILETVRSESSNRSLSELRNAAETGIDYATQQLNNCLRDQIPCSLEPAAGVPSKTTTLPDFLFPDLPNVKVNVKVRRLTAAERAEFRLYSSLYSPQLDPDNSATVGKNYSDLLETTTVKQDHWRILEATAQRGVFSRSIRTILEPRFDKAPSGNTILGTGTSQYFKNSFFGNSRLNAAPAQGSLTITDGVTPSNQYSLNLRTNSYADVGKGTDLLGNLVVSNLISGAPASIANGPGSKTNILDPSIHGRVITNGGTTDFVPSNGAIPGPLDSVRADAELSPRNLTRSSPNDVPLYPGANGNDGAGPAATVAPVPMDSSATTLPSFASIAADGGNLAAGSYRTGNLNATSSTLSQPINTVGTVKVFIQDGNFLGDAATISSSLFKNNGTASNLQIFYPGNRPINLTLDGPFNGVIYAPNAPVSVSGSGDMVGAIVGDKISITNNGTITVLTGLENSGSRPDLQYASTANDEPVLQGYKSVAWQETNRVLVPPP